MKILKKVLSLTSFSLICLLLFPKTVYAVPPPDFLFNVGAQIAQVFSIAVLFLGAIFSISYKFIRTRWEAMKSKKPIFIGISLIAIIGISAGAAYLYGQYKQNAEYEEWLAESQEYADLETESTIKPPTITPISKIDKLEMGATPTISGITTEEDLKFISTIENPDNDPTIDFIEDYYEAMANQELEKAYEMSKKSTNLKTFKSWYTNTTKITLDNLVRIDNTTSSLELTLYEDYEYTRYGTVMTLKFDNETPTQVASSSVRVLSKGGFADKGDGLMAIKSNSTEPFFTANENNALSINNSEFKKLLDSNSTDYIVLDAREDLEYENGHLDGSTHIRFADLRAGKWIEIPADKFVYVLCWSGIRGQEVAEFLRTKDVVASYLEGGATEWVAWGGAWTGNINFVQKYSEEKYKKLFTTPQVKVQVKNGAVLVDCREPEKFENWHISGSVSIPIMHTPTKDLDETFAQVPSGSKVITVCDGYVNCFDAKITAVGLEERGHEFLGRYNKPWEYE
jgi:rhodanese-related sulfurtransferase